MNFACFVAVLEASSAPIVKAPETNRVQYVHKAVEQKLMSGLLFLSKFNAQWSRDIVLFFYFVAK